MTDMILDLSNKGPMLEPKLEAREPPNEFGSNSDSGRASIGSENSDINDQREDHLSGSEDAAHSSRRESMSFSNASVTSPGHSSTDEDKKVEQVERINPVRPFKMYPMDPFSVYSNPLMASAAAASGLHPAALVGGMGGMSGLTPPGDSPLGLTLTPLTSHFLQRKRRQESRDTDPSSKKAKAVPVDKKDDGYWERRRKNNDAAKRSRDTRRQKEEEIAMRAAFLEQENLKLRAQVAILKNETTKLHYMLYNRC